MNLLSFFLKMAREAEEDLAQYEIQRLKNIARNRAMLISLGLETAEEKDPQNISHDKKVNNVKSATVQYGPSRKSSRLTKKPVLNYNDAYEALDRLDKDERKSLKDAKKLNRQIGARKQKAPQRFDPLYYDNPRKERKQRIQASEMQRISHDDVLANAVFFTTQSNHDSIDIYKWLKLGFTSEHLKRAKYPVEYVNAFIETENKIADKMPHLQCSPFEIKIYEPSEYVATLPHVYCPGCKMPYAMTSKACIRFHPYCPFVNQ